MKDIISKTHMIECLKVVRQDRRLSKLHAWKHKQVLKRTLVYLEKNPA